MKFLFKVCVTVDNDFEYTAVDGLTCDYSLSFIENGEEGDVNSIYKISEISECLGNLICEELSIDKNSDEEISLNELYEIAEQKEVDIDEVIHNYKEDFYEEEAADACYIALEYEELDDSRTIRYNMYDELREIYKEEDFLSEKTVEEIEEMADEFSDEFESDLEYEINNSYYNVDTKSFLNKWIAEKIYSMQFEFEYNKNEYDETYDNKYEYTCNNKIGNLETERTYIFSVNYFKEDFNNILEYFINLHKKFGDCGLIVALNKEYENIEIYVVNDVSFWVYYNNGFIDGYISSNDFYVFHPKNYTKTFCEMIENL